MYQLEKEEIQPVVYREIEQTEVKQITQPLRETETKPITVEKITLPAVIKPTVIQVA